MRHVAAGRGWTALGAVAVVVLALATAPASATVRPATTTAPSGYWLAGADGGVFGYGQAGYHGSAIDEHLDAPVVGVADTPDGEGYWLAAADGGVFAYGDASFFGSLAGQQLPAPIVAIAATPDGQGYWLASADGAVYAFGDAAFRGTVPGLAPSFPVTAMAPTPTGNGYWLMTSAGQIEIFGDATFHGSVKSPNLADHWVGMAATPSGNGYWTVSADGDVDAFGDAAPYGSPAGQPLASPVVGMAATPSGDGYWLVTAGGAVYAYGDAIYDGAAGSLTLHAPVVGLSPLGPTQGGHVLLVGTYDGVPGQYATIQDAVDAASPGDWILVAPGDYHEDDDDLWPPTATQASEGWMGGVDITTPHLHLRGMDRNTTIVDGTLSTATTPCSSAPADQNFGPTTGSNGPDGRNGILIWKADGVSVQNLTLCNFLGGSAASGNAIWWNGGDGSGLIGLHGYSGSYLTATNTYFGTEDTEGQYGIFSSNSAGPGVWNETYASNYNDSGMYIGACHQLCDAWVNQAWMQNDALGYSGTNSGGTVVVSNSIFDRNEDGFDTNTQIGGDPPAPQNGSCPDGGYSGITRTTSCWVFWHNQSFDNNNPNVPTAGSAAAGPTGTGMTVSGGTHDTVMDNRFYDNGAWGILFVPYPDSSTPAPGQTCAGTGGVETNGFGCVYDPESDALVGNTFSDNGYFKNPSNSDFGQIDLDGGQPQNCFAGNVEPDGSAPANLEQTQPTCGALTTGANTGGPLLGQVLCDTGFGTCPTGASYPQRTTTSLIPLPDDLPTMPNPCAGVPANPWCPGGRPG